MRSASRPRRGPRRHAEPRAAAHVWRRSVSIEAHLFDADGDCYGVLVRIDFVARLRDTVRFESPEALIGAAPPRRGPPARASAGVGILLDTLSVDSARAAT